MFSIIFALVAPVVIVGAVEETKNHGNLRQQQQHHDKNKTPTPFPKSPSWLTLDQFNSILLTEVHAEFGLHRSSSSDNQIDFLSSAEALWKVSMEDEWSNALEIEREWASSSSLGGANNNPGGRRRRIQQEKSLAYLPFLICDTSGRNGETCMYDIESFIGENAIPVYNKRNMSCFVIESLPSYINELSSLNEDNHLLIVPMTVEMKIQKDLVNLIADSDHNNQPLPTKYQAIFCPGETKTKQDGVYLADDIFNNFAYEISGRKLRQNKFLHSRKTRDDQRKDFWHRHLLQHQQRNSNNMTGSRSAAADADNNDDDDICRDIFQLFHLDVSQDANMMILTLPSRITQQFVEQHNTNNGNEDDENDIINSLRHCIYTAIIDIAMQPEICFVGGLQEVQPWNVVASGVIQNGSERSGVNNTIDYTSKPFYDVGIDGTGQIVAVSDSGLDTDNCYFLDSRNPISKDTDGTTDMSARKVIQYFSFADDRDSLSGHGTHVAATIAGRKSVDGTRESESDGQADGIAMGAKISFFDVGDGLTSILSVPDDFYDMFSPGYSNGARIHSASWGLPNNQYTTMDLAVDAYVNSHPDFLFVTAVGNLGYGNREHTVGSPAICKNGLAVGSNQNAPPHVEDGRKGPDYLAYFSSRGPTADGRLVPHIVAPGMHIQSARSVPDSEGECDNTIPSGIDFKSGTSMSAPVVSGAAALIRQYFVDGWYPGGIGPKPSNGFNPKASLVKAVLLNGAQRIHAVESETGDISYTEPYDVHQGFGRIDLLQSLPLANKNNIKAVVVNSKSIANKGHDKYEIVNDWSSECTKPLSATLVWTDPVGAPFCADCVLNDLDLYITKKGDSSSKRFYPNGLDSPDSTNNAERIQIINPEDGGSYIVHVEGAELIGLQQYSLVITGCLYEENSPSGPPISSWTPVPSFTTPPLTPTMVPGLPTIAPMENCEDGPGKIIVSSDPERLENCAWLARNPYTYGFLCEFVDIAKECPRTCLKCDVVKSIPTGNKRVTTGGFDGNDRWYGNRFNIQALKDISVTNMEVNVNRPGEFNIQIFTLPGSLSKERGIWETSTMICNTTVQSEGKGTPTVIPVEAFTSVEINAGEFQTFYVTLDEPDLVMVMENTDDPVFENEDIIVAAKDSVAVNYLDGRFFPNRSWNGRLRYELSTGNNDEVSSCEDKKGNVLINNYIGSKSCTWLASNLDRVQHACSYVLPAAHCPKTCGICEEYE